MISEDIEIIGFFIAFFALFYLVIIFICYCWETLERCRICHKKKICLNWDLVCRKCNKRMNDIEQTSMAWKILFIILFITISILGIWFLLAFSADLLPMPKEVK